MAVVDMVEVVAVVVDSAGEVEAEDGVVSAAEAGAAGVAAVGVLGWVATTLTLPM